MFVARASASECTLSARSLQAEQHREDDKTGSDSHHNQENDVGQEDQPLEAAAGGVFSERCIQIAPRASRYPRHVQAHSRAGSDQPESRRLDQRSTVSLIVIARSDRPRSDGFGEQTLWCHAECLEAAGISDLHVTRPEYWEDVTSDE
jgi:hypothetical protein